MYMDKIIKIYWILFYFYDKIIFETLMNFFQNE